MGQISSYPKAYNVGHAALENLLEGDVVVEEKIDGSQFSFMRTDREFFCRSKGAEIITSNPEKMFTKAVNVVRELYPILKEGWVYRGEFLRNPKHNTLAYDRIPNNHIILFDISPSLESYLSPEEKKLEAERLGLEVVPTVFEGRLDNINTLKDIMEKISILGGQKIEGLVIKNYSRFGPDGKALMGKHVSEEFKEFNKTNWKLTNPSKNDILLSLGESLRTAARWDKAIQHLKEKGELTNTPKDIGPLLKETQTDIIEECEGELKEALWKWAKPNLLRKAVAGLPEYYKEKLLESQFNNEEK